MNARENTLTPLRNLIAIYLDAVDESPADKIAKAIGKADYPSLVIKELNAMRTDGLVECEQRGKKKELTYWLSVPLSQVTGIEPPAAEAPKEPTPAIVGSLPAGITEGTRAAQIWSVLPDHGEPPISAREIAARAQKVVGLIAPVLTTMHQRGQIARVSESSEGYLYTRPAVISAGCTRSHPHEDMNEACEKKTAIARAQFEASVVKEPPAQESHSAERQLTAEAEDVIPPPRYNPDAVSFDPVKRAAAEKDCADAAPVAADEPHQVGDIDVADLAYQMAQHQIETAAEWLAEVVEGGEIEPCEMDIKELAMRASGELRNARAMIEKREQQLVSHEQAIGEIHRACADAGIPEGHVAERVRKLAEMVCTLRMTTNALAEDPAVDLQDAATGYLIRVPKRRPRVVTKPEAARAAALAAAKVAGRAEVMALVPVGKAVRGAEWRDA